MLSFSDCHGDVEQLIFVRVSGVWARDKMGKYLRAVYILEGKTRAHNFQ